MPALRQEGSAQLLTLQMHLSPKRRGLTLDEIERIAISANFEVQVAARRVAQAQAHVPTTSNLADPHFVFVNSSPACPEPRRQSAETNVATWRKFHLMRKLTAKLSHLAVI